jgi:hypothetical protein
MVRGRRLGRAIAGVSLVTGALVFALAWRVFPAAPAGLAGLVTGTTAVLFGVALLADPEDGS